MLDCSKVGELTGTRVLHIQKAKGIGGSERHIIDLCAGLQALGLQLQVLWLSQPGHPLDALLSLGKASGIRAEQMPIRGHLDPSLAFRIRRWLAANPTDIVHLHLIHATLYGVLAARMAGVRAVVATRHGNEPYQKLPWFCAAARMTDRACARIIVPSEWSARFTAHWDGTPTHKLRVIRHGIELERFAHGARSIRNTPSETRVHPIDREQVDGDVGQEERSRWGVGAEDLVIGCVARLHPSKDHETLLRAFAILRANIPNTHLLILGVGPLERDLKALAHKLLGPCAAKAGVHFLGERPDVETVLAACDVAVVSTHREGFCLAALEAMACGLPVVATRVGPLPELIQDGCEGFLVPPRDPAAMAKRLECLAQDPGLRHELGQAALMAARQYSSTRMIRETAALYEEILRPRETP